MAAEAERGPRFSSGDSALTSVLTIGIEARLLLFGGMTGLL